MLQPAASWPLPTLEKWRRQAARDRHHSQIGAIQAGANYPECPSADAGLSRPSGLFRGQIHLFKPALTNLDKQDAVAVAHWCDDGQSKLDLLPTSNVEEATTTLEQVLASIPSPNEHDRTGELALQKTLQLIIDATRSLAPEPVPVVIFLYGDYSGMPRSEADHFIDELLETSAVAYGLKDRRSPRIWLLGEQGEVANYIATETGGEYLRVTPDTYATGLREILRQLHGRYELGFKPETLDGKRHKLTVKLADAAKNQHKGVRLRYRLAYVPIHRYDSNQNGQSLQRSWTRK